ncbi:hypothetical protein ACQEUU_21110 [Nonomuraea sp. CA-218870]|uniref:hypothetical protein n=1 Tax=Nonomuraea sp. CA-218870 TaxID=3239998 RepID=UPI003D927C7E
MPEYERRPPQTGSAGATPDGEWQRQMMMAVAWVGPLVSTPALPPEELTGFLWRHATDDDGVQHLRVRSVQNQMMIFGFLMADSEPQARTILRNLTRKTISNEPRLRLWRIV